MTVYGFTQPCYTALIRERKRNYIMRYLAAYKQFQKEQFEECWKEQQFSFVTPEICKRKTLV